jgi:hemerythrin-like domain-containing protein
MNSFNELLSLHHQLDEIFLEHQRALVRGELEVALEKLEIYQRCLVDHILDEEEHLLPIYGERVQAPVGGSVEIFLFEHRKIRDYLPLFKAEFAKLYTAADRERAIIFLLDSQTTFKKLLVHHDAREQKFLYPLLDRTTTATERLKLFSRLRLRPREATVSA